MSRRMQGQGFGWVLLATLLVAILALPARAADTVVYYHTDALHSVAVVTNASGAVIERTHYAPYGQVLNRALRDGPGYAGHREDAVTGLVYMQQRYYDPESGRFLSTDPVEADGKGGNFNRYWYANDNPYRFTDPDGRQSCTGSHIAGPCGSNVTIIQVNPPSGGSTINSTASQRGAAMMNSPSSQPTMLASNSGRGDSVKLDESLNATQAGLKEYEILVKSGVIGKGATRMFANALPYFRGLGAGITAYNIGMGFAAGAAGTFSAAGADIRFYIAGGRRAEMTGNAYGASAIQWGLKVRWRPFDPGLNNSVGQIWINFLTTANMYQGDE